MTKAIDVALPQARVLVEDYRSRMSFRRAAAPLGFLAATLVACSGKVDDVTSQDGGPTSVAVDASVAPDSSVAADSSVAVDASAGGPDAAAMHDSGGSPVDAAPPIDAPEGAPPDACAPTKTCASVGANCGPIDDGCGHTLDCGSCSPGLICGWPAPNQCGCDCCPATCQSLGYNCGFAGDGCGGVLNCGTCTPPESCGGSGGNNRCGGGLPPPFDGGVIHCTPATCASLGYDCGQAADGCGGTINCGACVVPQECGAGGAHYRCGNPDAGTCTPLTCASLGYNCGVAGDGCGNVIMCGTTCTPPATCGGGGSPSVCGP
jgi:hypothetical protein